MYKSYVGQVTGTIHWPPFSVVSVCFRRACWVVHQLVQKRKDGNGAESTGYRKRDDNRLCSTM